MAMPAEEGLGLDNQEHLFPTADGPCEQDQKYPIRVTTSWTFDLTTKHDQLPTKQRIFGDEVSPGAGKISERCAEQWATRWPCPLEQALMYATGTVVDVALEQDEQT
jgi:hypothetical protein